MAKYKLHDLTKAQWNALKKAHNMKVKGALEAVFTKLTGANVGDAIDKWQKSVDAVAKVASTGTVKACIKATRGLEKALLEYAKKKEFSSDEAKVFKAAVLMWAKEAKTYGDDMVKMASENSEALAANEALLVQESLKNCGLL